MLLIQGKYLIDSTMEGNYVFTLPDEGRFVTVTCTGTEGQRYEVHRGEPKAFIFLKEGETLSLDGYLLCERVDHPAWVK